MGGLSFLKNFREWLGRVLNFPFRLVRLKPFYCQRPEPPLLHLKATTMKFPTALRKVWAFARILAINS